jgi:CHAT domain-containing protein
VSSFFALANPYTGLTPLPGTEREVDAISGLLPGVACRVLKRREASEAAFRAEAAGKSLLHLATHGDFPEQDAMDFHRARLSRSGDQDGLLDAEEIRRLDLRAVRAAVLSICNGGLYRFGPGDEPYGLMPAFLAAGAENVVGSLWPIDDQVGAAFMTALYRDLVARGPAEAVRRTSRELRGQGAPIRDWAGIVCVGPGRPLA